MCPNVQNDAPRVKSEILTSPHPVDLVEFGRQLATFRVAAGFDTQDAAAKAAGIERAQLNRHEAGIGGLPRHSTLQRYEIAYRLPTGSLSGLLAGNPVSRVSENVSRRTYDTDESLQRSVSFPNQLRLRQNQVERDLIEIGATDQEVADFRRSVRDNPLLAALFRGGAPQRLTNEEMLQLFDGVAEGFKAIIAQLVKERAEAKRRG
jgi:hypothetical protein